MPILEIAMKIMIIIAMITAILPIISATATGSSEKDNPQRKVDRTTRTPSWNMNSMWSSQAGGNGGWPGAEQTNNTSPIFEVPNLNFQLPMWGQGPYPYGPSPNFMGPTTMYHPQNWQIGGYPYSPQPLPYRSHLAPSEFEQVRIPENTGSMSNPTAQGDKNTR